MCLSSCCPPPFLLFIAHRRLPCRFVCGFLTTFLLNFIFYLAYLEIHLAICHFAASWSKDIHGITSPTMKFQTTVIANVLCVNVWRQSVLSGILPTFYQSSLYPSIQTSTFHPEHLCLWLITWVFPELLFLKPLDSDTWAQSILRYCFCN